MNYPLARLPRLSLEQFAAATGLHPDLVRRLVALGLLEPLQPTGSSLEFAPAQVARAARIARLRAGLALNYAAVGVVLDLLTRIEELEAALRARSSAAWRSDPWWT
jgi:DNA-binding transcriptional MerR regulator